MLNLKKPNTYQTHTLVNFKPVFLAIYQTLKKIKIPRDLATYGPCLRDGKRYIS